jgi:hypothetical protein
MVVFQSVVDWEEGMGNRYGPLDRTENWAVVSKLPQSGQFSGSS